VWFLSVETNIRELLNSEIEKPNVAVDLGYSLLQTMHWNNKVKSVA
jgi:hypothetical protein